MTCLNLTPSVLCEDLEKASESTNCKLTFPVPTGPMTASNSPAPTSTLRLFRTVAVDV